LRAHPFPFNRLWRGYIACFVVVVDRISFILGWGQVVKRRCGGGQLLLVENLCFTSTEVGTNSDSMMEMN
jgi:hypothetical protein